MFKTDSFIGNTKFEFNPIPIGCCHVTLIYGLIPPMAGRNRVKPECLTLSCYYAAGCFVAFLGVIPEPHNSESESIFTIFILCVQYSMITFVKHIVAHLKDI